MHPLLNKLTEKPFYFLRRGGWLSKQLLPAHAATTPLPDPDDFESFQGADGVHVSLRGEGGQSDSSGRFPITIDRDEDGELLGTGSVGEGSLLIPAAGATTDQPRLVEPHGWLSFFPFGLTGIVLECSIVLKFEWTATREITVDNVTGVDTPTSKYQRRLMTWALNTVTIEVVDTTVDTSGLNPVYDWAANTATTFIELARVTESLTEPNQPEITRLVYSDLTVPHPLQHDLETKPEVAFPPGDPGGPNDDSPIVFRWFGRQYVNFSEGLEPQDIGGGYCRRLKHNERRVGLIEYRMVTLAGQSYAYHEFQVDPIESKIIATLEPCDPLA